MGNIHNQDQYLTDGAELKAADGTTLVGEDGVETIADDAVDSDAIADDAVDTDEIVDGAVDADKLEGLADGEIIIGVDGTAANNAKVTVSGDGTLANDGTLNVTNVKSTTAGDETGGAIFYKSFSDTTIKPLLDSATNDLMEFSMGEYVLDVVVNSVVASGGVGTIDIGTDADWSIASDGNALVAALDINATGAYRMTTLDSVSQPAGIAGVLQTGAGPASLTITCSTDQSASNWEGSITVIYAKF